MSARALEAEQLAELLGATPELMTPTGRYLAVFTDPREGAYVLRDYHDEWARDANAPAGALHLDID